MRYRLGVQMGAKASAVPNNDSSIAPNPRKGALTAWHPTTAYLMALVIAEFAAYLLLRNVFKHAHGG